MGNTENDAMKIIHFRNIARIPRYLADAQRLKGHISDVFSFHINPYDVGADIQLDIEKDRFMPYKSIVVFLKFWKYAKKYDIIHFHVSSVFPKGLDLIFWKIAGKKVFLHHHGSEIRYKKEAFLVTKCVSKLFVSTPDLIEWSPRAIWIPSPIDISSLHFVGVEKKQRGERVVIVHAPTNRKFKGTEFIIKSIERLKSQGYSIDFILVENLPYFQALEQLKKADIVIDQVVPKFGFYSMVSIESMALGKPVVCTIKEEYRQNYFNELPIINCDTCDLDEKLITLIEDPDRRQLLGINGREYVMKTHDSTMVAEKIIKYYLE
jgi:glycosyltransferase involved in cell wall biosynthesis